MKSIKTTKVKQSLDNQIFFCITIAIILFITAICIIPFIYLIAVSLSGSGPVLRGEVFLWPKEFSLDVYKNIFKNGTMVSAMGRTIVVTFVTVIVSMVMTILCAYPLSVPGLLGKKIIIPFIMFTMYFSGGLIPGYLLINGLGLVDSYWSLIIPGAVSTYNMLVLRSFFYSIPSTLKEAAVIDGAGDVKILLKVVLPLSKPSLATIALWVAVGRWNGLQDALLYINDPSKAVLQVRLKQMIMSSDAINELLVEGSSAGNVVPLQTARAGALMFSMIPILIVYPFLQKYFVKGTMLGSVKG